MDDIIQKNYQSRKFLLTINNPTENGYTHNNIIDKLNQLSVSYFCMADEIGIETKTYHTHVFIYSSAPIRFSTLKNKFPKAHIDKAKGSCIDNRHYLLKDGKWKDSEKAETSIAGTFEEYGVMPSERAEKEPDLASIIEMFDKGSSVNDVIDTMPKYALRINELESLYSLRKENKLAKNRDVEVIYIFGETGTGKTHSVYDKYPVQEVCRITNYSSAGLFDSYHGQSVLVFDEYHSQISLPQMLTYIDVYPVALPARYHDRQANYNKVYILSNIELSQQYEKERTSKPKTWNAFLRHISHIYQQIGFDNRVELQKGDYIL